jgi:zinc transport system permease protein
MELKELFTYAFVWKALIAGTLSAVISSILGVFLVLRRMSLLGDGLSHVGFLGVALGLVLHANPIYVSVPIIVVSSLLIFKLTKVAQVYSDASIGMVSALGISSAVIVSSLARGFNADLLSFLFGSILTVSASEVWLCVILAIITVFTVSFFYRQLVSVTFDEELAHVSGINVDAINALLVILTGLSVALLLKVVGVMLVSALLIIPAVSALQFARGFKSTILFSCIFSALSVVVGIILSFVLDVPSGAMIVIVNFSFFVFSYIFKSRRN